MALAVWEPWTPEVGQRVRVRLSSECEYCYLSEDGATGTVCQVGAFGMHRHAESHRFWVTFDIRQHGCLVSHFAAIELDPLDHVIQDSDVSVRCG